MKSHPGFGFKDPRVDAHGLALTQNHVDEPSEGGIAETVAILAKYDDDQVSHLRRLIRASSAKLLDRRHFRPLQHLLTLPQLRGDQIGETLRTIAIVGNVRSDGDNGVNRPVGLVKAHWARQLRACNREMDGVTIGRASSVEGSAEKRVKFRTLARDHPRIARQSELGDLPERCLADGRVTGPRAEVGQRSPLRSAYPLCAGRHQCRVVEGFQPPKIVDGDDRSDRPILIQDYQPLAVSSTGDELAGVAIEVCCGDQRVRINLHARQYYVTTYV